MMTTFAATEATAAHSNRQTVHAEHTAQSKHAPNAPMADVSADASTLQRFQNNASSSPRAQQLRHQAEVKAARLAAMTLQRFQHMANNSPQALQLKRQAQMMAAGVPASDAVAAPGAVLQAVWQSQLGQAGMYQWDAVIDGKQWCYNASTNEYRYVVVDANELTFDGLYDAFGVEEVEMEGETASEEEIGNPLPRLSVDAATGRPRQEGVVENVG